MFVFFWLAWLIVLVFLMGSAIGSFLNVCIARLPEGQSLVSPGSRCGSCGTAIRLSDNLPLLSYWLLGGRCRACGTAFSMRYFWVELATGLAFVAVLLLEIGLNIHRFRSFGGSGFWYLEAGLFPPHFWPLFLLRLAMLCILLVAFCCALERRWVPRCVLIAGLLVAGGIAVFCAWPWPQPIRAWLPDMSGSWASGKEVPPSGMQPWPVWGPLPEWLPPGTWQLGLAIALAGALVGAVLMILLHAGLRGGIAAGQGDIGFMLLAGAFLGWQSVLVAVLLGALLAVPLALPLRLCRASIPAGLTCCLGLGFVAVWEGWPWLGWLLFPFLFAPERLAGIGLACLVMLPLVSLWLRWWQPPLP